MMNKKAIVEIDMDLILNGVVSKTADFMNEESVKVVHHGRPHTRAEKLTRDAYYRIKATGGKKHDRNREDYKSFKVMNDWDRSMRLYVSGDRKNKMYDEKATDALKNEISDFEYLKAEEERHEMIRKEILDRTAKRTKELKAEALKMLIMAKELIDNSEKIMEKSKRLEESLKKDS